MRTLTADDWLQVSCFCLIVMQCRWHMLQLSMVCAAAVNGLCSSYCQWHMPQQSTLYATVVDGLRCSFQRLKPQLSMTSATDVHCQRRSCQMSTHRHRLAAEDRSETRLSPVAGKWLNLALADFSHSPALLALRTLVDCRLPLCAQLLSITLITDWTSQSFRWALLISVYLASVKSARTTSVESRDHVKHRWQPLTSHFFYRESFFSREGFRNLDFPSFRSGFYVVA